jgi:hypothetical protein
MWVWSNIARVEGYRDRKKEYAEAIRELRKADEKEAKSVEGIYGTP